MLTIISDRRSGTKLELIVPTYNESENLRRIIAAYNEIADIVIIDDGSSDDTVKLAIESNCTVYKRNRDIEPVSFAPTEVPITFYVNNLTLSGKCAKLDADELISLKDFEQLFSLLNHCDIVLGKRIDVISGIQLNYTDAVFPIAFNKGSIQCINRLHSAIQPLEGKTCANIIFKNYHLDLVLEDERFGKMGRYCLWEITRVSKDVITTKGFYRRFFIPIFTFSIRNFTKHHPKFYFHYILKQIMEFLLAIVIVQNRKLFGDKEHQKEHSNAFFYEHLES